MCLQGAAMLSLSDFTSHTCLSVTPLSSVGNGPAMCLQGAAMLSLSDFTSHTCLSVTHLYTNEDIFVTPVITSKVSQRLWTFSLLTLPRSRIPGLTREDVF